MKGTLIIILLVLALSSTAAGQVNPLDQGATIWFYRPADSPNAGIPTLLHVGTLTRQLAKIAPGEFFGYSVPAGIHVFSYTRAPARGESLAVPVRSGQQAYVQVHFRELTLVSVEDGAQAIRQSRPISEVSVIDTSVIVVGATPFTRTPAVAALVAPNETISARPVTPPILVLPAQSVVVTSAPAPQPQSVAVTSAPAPQPQSVVVTSAPAPQPQSVAVTSAPAPQPQSVTVLSGSAPQPQRVAVTSAPAPQPLRVAALPMAAQPIVTPNQPRESLRVPTFPNTTEAFSKATLNLQGDDRKKETDVVVTFDKDALIVTDRKNRAVLKMFSYASIRGAEYSYAKSPRWNTAIPPSPFFLFASGKKHWFMVVANDDYALVELDKSNYVLVLAAFEVRTGRKVVTVEDSK